MRDDVADDAADHGNKMSNIRLRSDFIDYYDGAFANAYGTVFQRFAKTTRTRREDFQILAGMGLNVVRHGRVCDMADPLWTNTLAPRFLVVYDDETSHCGEGKRLVERFAARHREPNAFCSEYINAGSKSFRYLQVGRKAFRLTYQTNWRNEWRSNFGEPGIEVFDVEANRRGRTDPIFAVDFVVDELNGGPSWAIDFNDAPGLSPIQHIMSPEEVVAEIEAAMEGKL